MPTSQLCDISLPQSVICLSNKNFCLFRDTLAPPPQNLHRDCALLKVGKLTNISPQVQEGIFEGIRR